MRYLLWIALAAMIATVAYNIKDFAEIATQAPPATIAIGLGLLILAAAVAIIGLPLKLALVMAILCSTAYVMADDGGAGHGAGNASAGGPMVVSVTNGNVQQDDWPLYMQVSKRKMQVRMYCREYIMAKTMDAVTPTVPDYLPTNTPQQCERM